MKTGLIVYASSLDRLTAFYSHVFGLELIDSDSTYALLAVGDFELVLLETEISRNITIMNEPRAATPLKPTFFVETPLDVIGEKIRDKGGFVYSAKSWEFGGRQVCDAYDCEGNIFQLRIRKQRSS